MQIHNLDNVKLIFIKNMFLNSLQKKVIDANLRFLRRKRHPNCSASYSASRGFIFNGAFEMHADLL